MLCIIEVFRVKEDLTVTGLSKDPFCFIKRRENESCFVCLLLCCGGYMSLYVAGLEPTGMENWAIVGFVG